MAKMIEVNEEKLDKLQEVILNACSHMYCTDCCSTMCFEDFNLKDWLTDKIEVDENNG
jgi:hypothetical protein